MLNIDMLIRKGYKFRLNTSPASETLMCQFAGCKRFLWNKALSLQKEKLANKQRSLTYNQLANMLPAWKKQHRKLRILGTHAEENVTTVILECVVTLKGWVEV